MLSKGEEKAFKTSLKEFITYYAIELDKHFNKKESGIRISPYEILDEETNKIKEELKDKIKSKNRTAQDLENKIIKDYDVLSRGKSLFALITRLLSNTKRKTKHSKNSLLEQCYRVHRNEKIGNIISEIYKKIHNE